MTPQELQEFNEMKDTVIMLTNFVNSLGKQSTIPLDFDRAVTARLSKNISLLKEGDIAPTAHNITVHESGSGVYPVLNAPDDFLEVSIDGIKKYIPAFNS